MTITKDTHPNLWLFLSASAKEAGHDGLTEFDVELDHKDVDTAEATLDHVYDEAFGEK